MNGAEEIFRCKKDSTCDLSLFVIRRGEGQYPRVKTTWVTCQEKRWREKVREEHKTQAETVWEGTEAEMDSGEIRWISQWRWHRMRWYSLVSWNKTIVLPQQSENLDSVQVGSWINNEAFNQIEVTKRYILSYSLMQKPGQRREHSCFSATLKDRYGSEALPLWTQLIDTN